MQQSDSTISCKSVVPSGAPSILLNTVLVFAVVRSFMEGESILAPGSATDTFFFLISGAEEVGYPDRTDTRIAVALISAGNFFGETGSLDGESRVREIFAQIPFGENMAIIAEQTHAYLFAVAAKD